MSNSQTIRSVALFVLLVALFAGCVPIQAPTATAPQSTNTIEATFVCPDGTSLDTVFDNDARTVTVALPDGVVTLPQVESGSGARYSDGTTTLWNKGNEALVEVNGDIIYQECVTE